MSKEDNQALYLQVRVMKGIPTTMDIFISRHMQRETEIDKELLLT